MVSIQISNHQYLKTHSLNSVQLLKYLITLWHDNIMTMLVKLFSSNILVIIVVRDLTSLPFLQIHEQSMQTVKYNNPWH